MWQKLRTILLLIFKLLPRRLFIEPTGLPFFFTELHCALANKISEYSFNWHHCAHTHISCSAAFFFFLFFSDCSCSTKCRKDWANESLLPEINSSALPYCNSLKDMRSGSGICGYFRKIGVYLKRKLPPLTSFRDDWSTKVTYTHFLVTRTPSLQKLQERLVLRRQNICTTRFSRSAARTCGRTITSKMLSRKTFDDDPFFAWVYRGRQICAMQSWCSIA